jgi:DNA-binding transcriptional LysR family regulator
LGTRLLVRTTRRVEPTPQGAALLEQATTALVGLRRTVLSLRDRARLAARQVVVASTPMLAATTLPPIIRDYGRRYTDVQVKLLDLRYAEALASVDSGTADVAVLSFEGDDKRFLVQALRSEEMVLVVPPTHPLAQLSKATLEQVAACPLVLIEQYKPFLALLASEAAGSGLTMAESTIVGNLATMLGMLDAGLGATLLPRSIAAGHGPAQAMIEIDGLSLFRTFHLVRARKAKLGTAAQSFVRFLREAMGEERR